MTKEQKYTEQDYRDFARIGPDRLAGRFIRRFWQPIIQSDQLETGRPRRVRMFGEYFTVYRGESGQVVVTEDECPHRLTRLSLGWVEGDCIRCFYHGWKFEASGQCVDQPAEADKSKLQRIKIKSYPVREYLGLVFAYLGTDEAPEFQAFPEVDLDNDTVYYTSHVVPCSFFQRIENDLDEVHLHFVHRVSTDEVGLDQIPEISVVETDYGILRKGVRSNAGNNVTRTGRIFMPNIMMVITPGRAVRNEWLLHLAWRVPIDDETMMSFIINARKGGGGGLLPRAHADPDPIVYTEKILAGEMRVQDIDPDYSGLFNVQDNVALAGQGRIVDRNRERLADSDKGVILIRKLWEREMRNLAQGKKMKKWNRPTENLLQDGSREVDLAFS